MDGSRHSRPSKVSATVGLNNGIVSGVRCARRAAEKCVTIETLNMITAIKCNIVD